ncbi:MAG: N-acetyl-gamma-glutamyl-phosphate reductase [Desulfovibrio sp.]|jgi:N-acetyl-gamma-glutamyl-phosphate reductase|nr:N-acetyl-gamma-glutamyl-phosphate reductase [Desulfovibrio sp.]
MSPSPIRVGLVGVTGYTGMELTRLLLAHPSFRLAVVTSRQEAGQSLSALYPFLQGFPAGDLVVAAPEAATLAAACDLVFLAVPHGAAMGLAAELLAGGCKVVDLSADFRLRDRAVYEKWYGIGHTQAEALAEAVYGLPELYAEAIARARLVANPGCYPTASILGLYPALAQDLIIPEDIIIDAKSGVSGAGRGPAVTSLFCEVQDTFRAYNLGAHRHTPEIEQELSAIAGRPLAVSFTTHLLPVNRGILATIYTRLKDPALPFERIRDAYAASYADHPFVRLLPAGKLPEIRFVRGTFFCDIALVPDPRTGRLIILSAIDNLCRGASGQAVANANLQCGLPPGTGLLQAALVP